MALFGGFVVVDYSIILAEKQKGATACLGLFSQPCEHIL